MPRGNHGPLRLLPKLVHEAHEARQHFRDTTTLRGGVDHPHPSPTQTGQNGGGFGAQLGDRSRELGHAGVVIQVRELAHVDSLNHHRMYAQRSRLWHPSIDPPGTAAAMPRSRRGKGGNLSRARRREGLTGPSKFAYLSGLRMSHRYRDLLSVGASGYVAVGALLCAVGCGAPVFPKQLFTLEAGTADYPVMVSKTPATDAGRPIEANSGTHFAQSTSSYGYGRTRVQVTHTEVGESEMPASEKFAAKVRRTDKWIQVESGLFVAEDHAGYGYSSADRAFSLEGKAHQ